MARRYELRERATAQAQTRQRIVDATVELHREVGPARTTVAEIARRAGVQRLTVYNHFPGDAELFTACSGQWMAGHPPPDPTPWTAIADPDERLLRALLDTYAWYAGDEEMVAHVNRDAEVVPALAAVMAGRAAYEEAVVGILLAGRGLRGRRRAQVAAAIALGLDFATWRRLVRFGGLSPAEAADRMVAAAR